MLDGCLVLPILLFGSQCHKTGKGRTKPVPTDVIKSLLTWLISPYKQQGQLDVVRERTGIVRGQQLDTRNEE